MDESRVVEVQASSSVLPAQVESEAIDRLSITEAFNPLKHHHHRHQARRYRGPPDVLEQVGEGFVGEQPMALAVEQAVDRGGRQPLAAEFRARTEDVLVLGRLAECHAPSTSQGRDLDRCQGQMSLV